jgi:flotillin
VDHRTALIEQFLSGKAEGHAELLRDCGGDPRAAATLLMVEQIERLVDHRVETIKNLKIDKISVWDSGAGSAEGAEGSTITANFLSGFIRSLPPLDELSHVAGIDVPDYLGRVSDERPAAAPAATVTGAGPAGTDVSLDLGAVPTPDMPSADDRPAPQGSTD